MPFCYAVRICLQEMSCPHVCCYHCSWARPWRWPPCPAARTPKLSLVEQAQSCDGGHTCPHDVYKADYAFRKAFNVGIKKAGLKRQRWVPDGVASPLKPVEIDGKARLLTSVENRTVRPPLCHSVRSGRAAWRACTWAAITRAACVYFGEPSIAEADMLIKN